MANQPNKTLLLQHVTVRYLVLSCLTVAALTFTFEFSPLGHEIQTRLLHPLEFTLRSITEHGPKLDPRLKIFALDNSSFAKLQSPNLESATWARMVRALVAENPQAILTTHMFGANEFGAADSALAAAASFARERGVGFFSAAFSYDGTMRHRASLPLDRPEYDLQRFLPQGTVLNSSQALAIRKLTADWRGRNLYGTTAESARFFAGVGHVDYQGDGFFAPFGRFPGDRIVPNLGLYAAQSLSLDPTGIQVNGVAVPLTDDGHAAINFLSSETMLDEARSLESLFQRMTDNTVGEVIHAGDVVLILPDMYTGRATFLPTPLGPMPGGLVVASTINSVLSKRWLYLEDWRPITIPLGILWGTSLAILLESFALAGALTVSALILAGGGISAFIFAQTIIPWFAPMLALVASCVTISARKSILRKRHDEAERLKDLRETLKFNTILRTAQMLAHDIRKPFSIIDTVIASVATAQDPDHLRLLLSKLEPGLRSARSAVSAMITDLLEIDAPLPLTCEIMAPDEVLLRTLRDVFGSGKNYDIRIESALEHTQLVRADQEKVRRVLSNILENAVQAMSGRGTLWLNTSDLSQDQRSYVCFCLGNDQSYIEPEILKNVFEPFFSRGKSDGTGLGLAIAKRVVTAHGGQIWCESDREKGTKFWFTLPAVAGDETTLRRRKMPNSSQDLAEGLTSDEFLPHVVIVDDSPFVLEAWRGALKDARVTVFDSPAGFMRHLRSNAGFLQDIDCIVTDFHFDNLSNDTGLTFASQVRSLRRVPILLSTDATVNDPIALNLTDGQISKQPMTYASLKHHLQMRRKA